ncbi:MAG TPA: hypothetical protein DGT23_06875 [Micromonosporaceae bacterium]|nr:hypothetical protein [Micromonosporaceae bacterium]
MGLGSIGRLVPRAAPGWRYPNHIHPAQLTLERVTFDEPKVAESEPVSPVVLAERLKNGRPRTTVVVRQPRSKLITSEEFENYDY